MKCRNCGHQLDCNLIDLGTAPHSNAFLSQEQISSPEAWYPLQVQVCRECWLVQTTGITVASDIFDAHYVYLSSISESWLLHAREYVHQAVKRFALGKQSHIIEVACNDGYLLRYFKQVGIPCLGIEPSGRAATLARGLGIEIVEDFLDTAMANELISQGRGADLVVANNVLAHVPNISDFTRACGILLKSDGVITFEFPHLDKLIANGLFDTIYHEHYSYLSLTAVDGICRESGLGIFDVEQLTTHGGSLRVFAQKLESGKHDQQESVSRVLTHEERAGGFTADYYQELQPKAERIKYDLLGFLLKTKNDGKRIAAYGAAAKGNTLLNFCGIRRDLVSFVSDRNSSKQGMYLPGSRIPVYSESALKEYQPDFVLVLPWNLLPELSSQLSYVREWGGTLVTAVPQLCVHSAGER